MQGKGIKGPVEMDNSEKIEPDKKLLSARVKELPSSPGVYIMKDKKGDILYVGKAGNLRKRVTSYFYPRRNLAGRLLAMVERISDISYIPASTEAEALIYENSLIKQLSPKYNVALRDDKSYPMLKLTVNEQFPRLFITRQKKDDGSIYYGPFTNVKLLREALIILRQIFPLRSCGKIPKNVCLNYHIKQCVAPCAGKVSDSAYGGIVAELKLFLEGRTKELLKLLSGKMFDAAKKEDFEEAGRIKRRIEVLGAVKENSVRYGPAEELEELKDLIGLKGPLEVIEAFDVSNIMGKDAVGSMISFYKGRPMKSRYRKFRIKTVSGVDDYAMMREIVRRRYTRLTEEKERLPDLILIDGGRGHLQAGVDELEKIGLGGMAVMGIAKEFEHLYIKDRPEAVALPKESKALHLLKRIRDEAHRFAISYHKNLRKKSITFSELDGISGVGPKRKKALIGHFGDIDKIKAATLEDFMKVEGVDEKSAKNIIQHFKEK